MKNARTLVVASVLAAVTVLTACGGGGGGAQSGAATTPAGSGTSGASSSSSGQTNQKVLVSTLPSGSLAALTVADCTKFATTNLLSNVTDPDAQEIDRVLQAVDPSGAYQLFLRASDQVVWWTRSTAEGVASSKEEKSVNILTLGTGVHEALHLAGGLLKVVCTSDRYFRYYIDGTIYTSGLRYGDTSTISTASEQYPTGLQTSRAQRYSSYVVTDGSYTANQFQVLLDELAAYSVAAGVEQKILSNTSYSYLNDVFARQKLGLDINSGGMVDFMHFMLSYLKAARLSHTSTYTAIAGQPATLAIMQLLWTKAEGVLASTYPYSVKAGKNIIIPTDVIASIYSPTFLMELDLLGITHKSAADWSTTYLAP